MTNKILNGWEGKGKNGYIKVTKEEADFLRSGTPSELRNNPTLNKFLEGLGKAMREDMMNGSQEIKKGGKNEQANKKV